MTAPRDSDDRLRGVLLRPQHRGAIRLEPGRIQLTAGSVTAIEPIPGPAAATLICPAFIDAHLHLPQFGLIGAHGLPLLEWLQRVVYPAEARWSDPGAARADSAAAARRLLRAGTVGVAAYATSHGPAAQAAIEELAQAGLRGVAGQVLMDREAPAGLVAPADAQLEHAAALRGAGRIAPAITPRFAISCTPQLLAGAGRLAAERGWLVQTHLAETEAECARVRDLFDGRQYLDVYREAGLLQPGALFAHGIYLTDADREALADSRAVITHCPTANSFLGSGRMDLRAMRAAGVRIALGSDVGAGPDVSMVRVARAMAETAVALGHAPPTSAECFWQITRGNAEALGWADAGRIEPGAPADLLVIEPDIDWRSAPDPLGALLFGWDDRWIRAVIAQGRIVHGSVD
ncbi:MAG: amidohydrolase family protein [Phycisphaerales bacterium JB039]